MFGIFGADVTGEGNQIKTSGNMLTKIQATNSRLIVRSCMNTKGNVEQSAVSLRDCMNGSIKANQSNCMTNDLTNATLNLLQDAALTATDCTNLNCSASGGRIQLVDDVNSGIQGRGNCIVARDNVNMSVKGDKNCLLATDTTNLTVTGSSSNIIAIDMTNLTIKGDKNQVSARDSPVCLNLSRALEKEMKNKNRVDFLPSSSSFSTLIGNGISVNLGLGANIFTLAGQRVSSDANTTFINNCNIRAAISYSDGVYVNGKFYIVGAFSFELEANNGNRADLKPRIKILSTGLDNKSIASKVNEGRTSVEITGKKDGVPHTLTFTGTNIAEEVVNQNGVEKMFRFEV